MRFCIAIWASLLLLATPAFGGGGTEGESCQHDDHSEHGKCKHGKHGKKRYFKFEYDWSLSASDDQLGKEKYDDDKFIRKISGNYGVWVHFNKKKEEYKLSLLYGLTADKASDSLLIATVNAELPRSYLSVEVGKGELHANGHLNSSPYLSYHSPFSTYGVMGRIYAPIEGFGELSLMATHDVLHDEEKHGDGKTRRWHVERQTIAPLFQYSGEFGMVSPLLQFAFYDHHDNWYRSWVATAGLKIKVDKTQLELDGSWDNRCHPQKDCGDNKTVYKSMVAELKHRHGMVTAELDFAMLMTDHSGESIEANRAPTDEKDKPEGYDGMGEKDEKKTAYDHSVEYHKGDWMKYQHNMTTFAATLHFHCIEDKFVPYVYYGMKYHKHDEKDGDDNQMSHTIAVGIWGLI